MGRLHAVAAGKRALAAFCIAGGCLLSTEGSATILEYGMVAEGTWFQHPRLGELPPPFPRPTPGRFSFDTTTNQVLNFQFNMGVYESSISGMAEDVNEILSRHPGCNIDCFINAINGSPWVFFDGGGPPGTFLIVSFTGGDFDDEVVRQLPGNPTPFGFGYDATYSVNGPIPEPVTWAMMALGFGSIGAAMRRRRSAKRQAAFPDKAPAP